LFFGTQFRRPDTVTAWVGESSESRSGSARPVVTGHDSVRNAAMREPPRSAIRIATWNVEWATLGTLRGARVAESLASAGDVLVVTECTLGILPAGHIVDAGDDWGYRVPDPTRRKLALWSKWPWRDVDPVGDPDLPSGRFVAATTSTPIGDLRVVGVCIPWAAAHVSSGRRDRRQWEEHAQYLRALPDALASQSQPFIVAGDFNQRIPRRQQPEHVYDLLLASLGGLHVATSGDTESGQLIDHIAMSEVFTTSSFELIPASDHSGPLSDHAGVSLMLERAPT
jgi:exonuclease III